MTALLPDHDLVFSVKSMKELMEQIMLHDTDNYELREKLIWILLAQARLLNWKGGVRIDPNEPDWPVVTIELPENKGQISWHMSPCPIQYDGHDTKEKFRRITSFLDTLDAK